MSHAAGPSDAPPAYGDIDADVPGRKPQRSSLEVPEDRPSRSRSSSSLSVEPSSLSAEDRRSFEDEHRPLPEGWVRQYDHKTHHIFFVDTRTERAIWHHPEDDEQYQREQAAKHGGSHPAKHEDSTATKDPHRKVGVGEKLKNKVTGTTHEERVAERKRRAEAERKAEQEWLKRRQAMREQQAKQQAQYMQQGSTTYGPGGPGYQAGPNYVPQQGYPQYGYSRYSAPVGPYNRGYGYGRGGFGGGGFGYAPMLGGLAGGLLLGDLLF